MSKIKKKVLGLKISGPSTTFGDNGKRQLNPSTVGWAVVEQVKNNGVLENITQDEVLSTAKEAIGIYLKGLRTEKDISIEKIAQIINELPEVIEQIEAGTLTYTIDIFLKITNALDCYFVLREREGEHLNIKHIKEKIKQ